MRTDCDLERYETTAAGGFEAEATVLRGAGHLRVLNVAFAPALGGGAWYALVFDRAGDDGLQNGTAATWTLGPIMSSGTSGGSILWEPAGDGVWCDRGVIVVPSSTPGILTRPPQGACARVTAIVRPWVPPMRDDLPAIRYDEYGRRRYGSLSATAIEAAP